jgi:EAL domain-containing protein (putative c-di-GMP-specific phosphodiesterase class I)
MALKAAKASHRNRYVIYNPSIDQSEKIAKNIRISKQLKQAIASRNIVPYFQPIIDLETDEVIKYEALARLRLNEKEVLTPFHFLQAAKLSKLSGALTQMILEQTLEVASCTKSHFSVNITAGDILDEEEVREIFSLLHRYHDVAPLITFEILESEEIEDYDAIADFIKTIKKLGCHIAIDDFGSGYSNYEKLLQLDIDIVKIDGSLIKDVDHDDHAKLVVKTIVAFAKGAKLRKIAEFVHSAEVMHTVKKLCIDCVHGFYLGKPMPRSYYFKKDCE